jgi:hypothetical protein
VHFVAVWASLEIVSVQIKGLVNAEHGQNWQCRRGTRAGDAVSHARALARGFGFVFSVLVLTLRRASRRAIGAQWGQLSGVLRAGADVIVGAAACP